VNSLGLESTHINAPYQKGINPGIIGPLPMARHNALLCIASAKVGPSRRSSTLTGVGAAASSIPRSDA
jgi:hypothetical protein